MLRISPAPGRPAPSLPAPGSPGLAWLGQAGFWIETGAHRILIDPYLSDSLAVKYAGRVHDHRRMMPPPVLPDDLPRPDLVLATHAHTDHLDPETLGPLLRRWPDLPLLVPAASLTVARERTGPQARLIGVDAGDVLMPLPGLVLTVLPAAHELLDRDAAGRHPFLGYGIAAGGLTLYHSGDCVPFDGLADRVAALAPDIALLPVNGRDGARRAAGIPGNFALAEAIALARVTRTPFLIPHHFGMFAFNTCDPALIDRAAALAADRTGGPAILRPVPGQVLDIRQDEVRDHGPDQTRGG